jgi:prevent-host-death family protein
MVMRSIAVSEFKAHCLALLEDIAQGGEPIVVTKRGKPIARVVPSASVGTKHPQDTLAGSVTIIGDVMEPVLAPSDWDAVRGQLLPATARRAKRAR